MYFEIFKDGKLQKRGREQDILGEISWQVELMEVPSMDLTLPAEYLDYISGREEIKVYAGDRIFWGIVVDLDVDKDAETIDVTLNHIVHEWTYRLVSINNAVKDKNVNIIYKGSTTKKSGGISITANPFNIFLSEVGKISQKVAILRANAQAWKANGDKTPITVNLSKLEKKTGDYDISFTSGTATVTVKATVIKDGSKQKEGSSSEEPSVIDNIEDIYADTNFAYPGWEINFEGDAGDRNIDYVYSKQNKLEALTQTCELTDDLFWRVDFSGEKRIDIGVFGEKKPYMISKKPPGKYNIQMVGELSVDNDFENVINVATVYSQKSDSGMSSLTLREVYNNPQYQKEGFPVVILRANVNNERDYSRYSTQYPKLAGNNEFEYAILDEYSIALEAGNLIEDAYEFNDIGAFSIDGKITDKDRIRCAVTVYNASVRKLKQLRRSKKFEAGTSSIPNDVRVGDKVRLAYDNYIYKLGKCSNFEKKIMSQDDYFYVTQIEYTYGEGGGEIDSVTLEKQIKVDRETKNT